MWRRAVKAKAAIYEANRMAATKAKRAARKSRAHPTHNINTELLPTCPRCQQTFHARIGLVGHLRTQCNNNLATPPAAATNTFTTFKKATIITPIIGDHAPDAPPASTTATSIISTPNPATTATTCTTLLTPTIGDNSPDAPSNTTLATNAPRHQQCRLALNLPSLRSNRPGRPLANPSN
ncbi:hypothetical protein SprV_0301175700 [Sparganum proliferum]